METLPDIIRGPDEIHDIILRAIRRANPVEFYRADGRMICETCDEPYYAHPWDPESLGYDGDDYPSFRILCNGDRVKL